MMSMDQIDLKDNYLYESDEIYIRIFNLIHS